MGTDPEERAKHYLEYVLARGGFGLMGLLPYDLSLNFFGGLFARLGPHMGANNRILGNLEYVGGVLPAFQPSHLAREIWRNFGQTLTDLAHLRYLRRTPERITIEGGDFLDQLKAEDGPVLFFSAHIACWDIIRIAAQRHGFVPSMLYRRFNNPFVDAHARKVQKLEGAEVLAKGKSGAQDLIRLLKAGKSALLLVDQRFANGVEVDFLGKPAMTAPAIVALGLKYKAQIVPAHVVRTSRGHHKVVFEAPLEPGACTGAKDQEYMLLQQVNRKISDWIVANPQQWFWFHRRWKGMAGGKLGSEPDTS